MTTPPATAPVPLPALVISHGGRRRITHVSTGLAEAFGPFVRVATPGEHRAVLTGLLLLITATDAGDDSVHPAPGHPVDCAAVPALGQAVRLHALGPGGGLLASLPHETAPRAPQAT
ncbi:hypothetical protein ABZY03_33645 [Streptomyces klenkii]|uniref:hypothetical protein n=1 Tax=Streptomyces klenkii TaxID=1420899 RepID=UPI0033A0862F